MKLFAAATIRLYIKLPKTREEVRVLGNFAELPVGGGIS